MRLPFRPTAAALLAAIGLAASAPAALAAHHDLSLDAAPSDFFLGASFDSGATHFDFHMLQQPLAADLLLQEGDTLTVTLNLSAPYTVPTSAAVYLTTFTVLLRDSSNNFPSGNTDTAGDATLFLNGVPSSHLATGSSTSGQVAFGFAQSVQGGQGLSFDQVVLDFTITHMDSASGATANTVLFDAVNFSPAVPEPATTALWLAGIGALALRRRRTAAA